MVAAALTGRDPNRLPQSQGLYDPANEHDACGVGMVADLQGRKSHDIVEKALTVLRNLDHRGAKGAEPDDGDGAGILTQIPDGFFREVVDFPLPEGPTTLTNSPFCTLKEMPRSASTSIFPT